MSKTNAGMLGRMQTDADSNGYFLCPDAELLEDLLEGLVSNEDLYGYASCPCRFSSGRKTYDSDIICPCEYRDADVAEYGACFCGLFVSQKVKDDPKLLGSVPERRLPEAIRAAVEASTGPEEHKHVQAGVEPEGLPVWRCTVCGYIAVRETPPPVCPICKVKADRFQKMGLSLVPL